MKMFQIKLRHDMGETFLMLNARDESAAIALVMDLENCPRQSIIEIKEI